MRHLLSLLACSLVLFAPTIPAAQAASADFAGALNALAAGKSSLDTLQISVQGFGSPQAITIYGDGIVVYNQDRQRLLAQKQVEELVKDLCDAGFAGMPARFGSFRLVPGMWAARRATRPAGSLTVTIGAAAKEIIQFAEGEQSPELAALARKLQAVCSDPGDLKTASSFADGLDKLSRGELSPETFDLCILRNAGPGATADDPTWELSVVGRTVVYSGRTRALSPTEFAQLIHLLIVSGVATFPSRLYAPHYTDYEFHVLNQQCSGQARADFFGIGPTTQGDAQKSWDQLFASLATLYKTGHLP